MFVFSSHTCPAHSETSTATLTTPALDRRSLRGFGVSACTATPEDLPPSLAQHGSCRRSSTSSSLPFRTHMGAENSVVGVDLPRWGPMLSPRVPNLVPIPGPRMERETPGQRPRPNYGHPQAAGWVCRGVVYCAQRAFTMRASGGALLLRAATDAGTYYVANRPHTARHGTINIAHPKRHSGRGGCRRIALGRVMRPRARPGASRQGRQQRHEPPNPRGGDDRGVEQFEPRLGARLMP